MLKVLNHLFGGESTRFASLVRPLVSQINNHEEKIAALSDEALAQQTVIFKERLAQGAPLDSLLPEAFATVREAAKRVLGQRHYDVQLMGGIALHQGKIAEMKTGEGKTLVGALPAYLNALTGQGVHIITVNDYLAKRDAGLMGAVHRFLGLSVGVAVPDIDSGEKRAAYACDITYGTNNEFGFDYLRDNLALSPASLVQRGHAYAIIDEVDSVLVDEARTPLIISGAAEDTSEWYILANAVVATLQPKHYDFDEKSRSVSLNDAGSDVVEQVLNEQGVITGNLYDGNYIPLLHHINQALRAHVAFKRDRDYIVRDDKVVIIDEFTGRMMQGRRYSEGLHQAIEAKEQVQILPENRTLASVTFQNYFRLYKKISGMTGTAMTEARELSTTYGLTVVEIPTNRPLQRRDDDDEIYLSEAKKIKAIVQEIAQAHEKGQPVLAGTASVEKSELLSQHLQEANIPHSVLNARFHEKEAEIIAQAGRFGAVTIATNMAGRGTDIQLGGNLEMRVHSEVPEDLPPEEREQHIARIKQEIADEQQKVLAAGGLYVLGTERHESRRIDNQLRGRAGRQGDPGRSRFFLSLQDDLMRIFGNIDAKMRWIMNDSQSITHPVLNRILRKAQQRVEAHHYETRRQVLKYDDIFNEQRHYIFAQRREMLHTNDTRPIVEKMMHDWLTTLLNQTCPIKQYVEQWDLESVTEQCLDVLGTAPDIKTMATNNNGATFRNDLTQWCLEFYRAISADADADLRRDVERNVVLRSIDSLWQHHIATVDALMHSVGLRGYAQKDPLNEFRIESFKLFRNLQGQIQRQSLRTLVYNWPFVLSAPEEFDPEEDDEDNSNAHDYAETNAPSVVMSLENDIAPMSRNAPCPCGSGQRFKHCCGALMTTTLAGDDEAATAVVNR